MESSVGNLTNIKPAVAGILIPPDKMNKPVIYSNKIANQNLAAAQRDVYKSTKKIDFEDRYKTPKSVFWAIGLAALACVIPFVKKIIKR